MKKLYLSIWNFLVNVNATVLFVLISLVYVFVISVKAGIIAYAEKFAEEMNPMIGYIAKIWKQ